MLSRIADSMYWMARYLERAGETARLMEIAGLLAETVAGFVGE